MHEKLQAYMAKCGLPSEHVDLNLDGTIHRYGKEGPQDDKAEWYIGFELDNGELYCSFGSWSHDQEKHTYKSWEDNNPHAEKYLEQAKALREKHLEEERKQAKQALEFTSQVWDKAPLASHEHPYLRRKKVQAHGIKTHQGKLLIPRYDSSGSLASVQTIAPDGLKKNAAGLPCKATYFALGEQANPHTIRFCEGYATAATIFEQTGDMTVVCFSCGNIFGTTFLLKEKHPNANLILNADKKTEKVCEKWEKQFSGEVQVPKNCEGTDFNDLFSEKGEEELKKQLSTDAIQTMTLSDLFKMELPKREYIMYSKLGGKSPILVEGTSTLLYAGGGVGKTMFLYEAAIAMAAGQNFLYYTVERPWKVFYLDTEMDANSGKERLLEIVTRRKAFDPEPAFHYYNLCIENLLGAKRRVINLYCAHTRNLLNKIIEKNEIIIIDNLQNATRDYENEGKENSSTAWCVVYDWMKEWQDRGKTFIVAHHENRSGGYRGSSRLEGDFDNIFHLVKPGDPPMEGFEVIYEIEKGRSIPQQLLYRKISAHKSSTAEKMYGWNVKEIPNK